MRHKQPSVFSFDLFAPDIKMNFRRQGGISTKVGTVFSVVFLGLFSYLGYLILSDFFDTSKPSVSQSVQPTNLPPIIEFSEDKLFPMALFQYQTIFQLKKEDLARFVTIQFTKIEVSTNGEPGNLKTDFKDLKIVPCGDLAASGKTRSFFAENDQMREALKSSGICVDPEDENFTIGRRTEKDAFFQNVIWRILPCTLPSGCATAEELAKVTFTPVVPKPIQDLANKKVPIRYVTNADEVHYLSTAFTSRQTYNLLKTEVVDEDGFLFGKKVTERYSFISSVGLTTSDRNTAQLSCTATDIEFGNCKPYFLLTFQTSPQKMLIERKYKGMVETFSELGGMVDMLFMLFFFPYSIYNARVFKEQLVQEVFGMQKPSKGKIRAETGTGSTQTAQVKQQAGLAPQESYKAVFENIEDCLDVAHIYRELLQIKQLLTGQGAPVSEEPLKSFPKANFDNRAGGWPVDRPQAPGHPAQTIKHKNSITQQKKPAPKLEYQSLQKAHPQVDPREFEYRSSKQESTAKKIDLLPHRQESQLRPDFSEDWQSRQEARPLNQQSRDSLGHL